MQYNKKIILEDGSEYSGYGFGADRDCVCEIVFNTSMTGYQEILSDPSYTNQAVVLTYPLIGNYGMAEEDYETCFPTIGGLIVREYNDEPSNFRSIASLSDVMKKYGIITVLIRMAHMSAATGRPYPTIRKNSPCGRSIQNSITQWYRKTVLRLLSFVIARKSSQSSMRIFMHPCL